MAGTIFDDLYHKPIWVTASYTESRSGYSNSVTYRVTISIRVQSGYTDNEKASVITWNVNGEEATGETDSGGSTYVDVTVNNVPAGQAGTLLASLQIAPKGSASNYGWNGTVTLPAGGSWTVSYSANGGSGAPDSQTKNYNSDLTLSSTKPTYSGYRFDYWAGSDGNNYNPSGKYSGNANLGLTAHWTAVYIVSYNANGGTGAPASQTKVYNTTLTLSSTVPTRDKYAFEYWVGSDGNNYSPGGSYTGNAALTLTAKWKKLNIPVFVKKDNTLHQVEKAYVKVNNEVKECTIYTNVGGQIKPIT